ncbi:hypothetical protein EI427_22195 [Flammeovirga pectinis]|uniref:Uncharacterized protein n=2 Tax=Flammeovirga pectinis TaxID=2494373 RepID=A0A3Q9FSC1_9BACT|nr:hypothetical protein EI427_22195 [Flammeovirga pectinis]
MRSKLFHIIMCVNLWVTLPQVYAQVFDTTTVLNEVEIVGARIPERISFKSTTIQKEQIDHYLSASLGELLTLNTPIFIKSYGAGGTATPSFRGTGASHTQVYWNGINLNSPMLGQVDLSLFPIAFTDEVVVNYGGSSLLYGTGGLGGAIQLNSAINWDNKRAIMGSQTINSLQNSITNMSVSVGNKKVQSTTKLFYKDAQNIFDFENPIQPGTPTWTNDHSAQLQYGFLEEVALKINQYNQLKFNVWFQESERELVPSMDKREADSWQGDTSLRLFSAWNYSKNKFNTEVSGAYIIDNIWYKKALNNDKNPKLSTSESRSDQLQLHQRGSYQISNNLLLRGGWDYYMDKINSSSYEPTGTTNSIAVTQHTIDIYGGLDYQPTTNLSVSLLIRQEWIDSDTKPILPSLGTEYCINPYSKAVSSLKANISKNFHAPSLNDRYWYPVGNPDLLPEEGWTYEATYSLHSNNKSPWQWSYELTAFNSIIHNWIVWKPAISNLWRPENLKKVHSRGLEQVAEISYQKEDWRIQLFTSVSFVKSENMEAADELDNSVGKQLIYTPVSSFQGYLQINYKKLYFIVEQQAYGKRYTQTDGSEYLPPYYLTNLCLGKQFTFKKNHFDVKARVENIFNYHYQSVARKPMPGRVYQMSVTYKL